MATCDLQYIKRAFRSLLVGTEDRREEAGSDTCSKSSRAEGVPTDRDDRSTREEESFDDSDVRGYCQAISDTLRSTHLVRFLHFGRGHYRTLKLLQIPQLAYATSVTVDTDQVLWGD